MIFVDTGLLRLFSLRESPPSTREGGIPAIRRAESGRRSRHQLDQVVLRNHHVWRACACRTAGRVNGGASLLPGRSLASTARLSRRPRRVRLFQRYSDKSYSAFDCLSFVVMERLGIREALAIDEGLHTASWQFPGPLPRAGQCASPPPQRERSTRPHGLAPADRASKTMSDPCATLGRWPIPSPVPTFALRAWRRAGQARHVDELATTLGTATSSCRPPRDLDAMMEIFAPAAAHRRGVAGRRAQEPRQPGATGRRSRVPSSPSPTAVPTAENIGHYVRPGEGEGHRASDDRRLAPRVQSCAMAISGEFGAVPGPVRGRCFFPRWRSRAGATATGAWAICCPPGRDPGRPARRTGARSPACPPGSPGWTKSPRACNPRT